MQAVTSPIAHHIQAKKVIDVPPSDLEQNDVDDATTDYFQTSSTFAAM